MTRCERCDEDDRVAVRRAKMVERAGRMAIVRDVPMEECSACGERYLDWEIAGRLDQLFDSMLACDVEIAARHFEAPTVA